MTRVLISHMGACGTGGDSLDQIVKSVLEGRMLQGAINPEIHFNPRDYVACDNVRLACFSPHSDSELAELAGIRGKKQEHYDRHQLFAELAVQQTFDRLVERLGLSLDMTRVAIVGATGDGGLKSAHDIYGRLFRNEELTRRDNLKELPNMFVGNIARSRGIKGSSHVDTTACAAGLHAINRGYQLIKLGDVDVVLVVGTESAITAYGTGSFSVQTAMSADSCLPFRVDRNGFLMGEGAAVMVLVSKKFADDHDLEDLIIAEIVGYGATTDGEPRKSAAAPSPEGGCRAAQQALSKARMTPGQIDLISAHATATEVGDEAEIRGIKMWAADQAENIMCVALKSHIGHWLGAAGIIEAAIAIDAAMLQGLVPYTRGLTEDMFDTECSGVYHVMEFPRKVETDTIMKLAFGFGGTNAATIFKRYTPEA